MSPGPVPHSGRVTSLLTLHSASKQCRQKGKWGNIFFESEICLSSLQVNVYTMSYEHAQLSDDDDDERALQVCLKMKEMSVLLSGFISLNSSVFYTLLSSTIPSLHLSVLTLAPQSLFKPPTQLSDPTRHGSMKSSSPRDVH